MHFVDIDNLTQPLSPQIHAGVCDSFYYKFRGLMFYPTIDQNQGMLFIEKQDNRLNSAIHMFFMRFDISVFWFNQKLELVDKALARKWKPYYAPRLPASYILETHPAQLENFRIGDKILIKNV